MKSMTLAILMALWGCLSAWAESGLPFTVNLPTELRYQTELREVQDLLWSSAAQVSPFVYRSVPLSTSGCDELGPELNQQLRQNLETGLNQGLVCLQRLSAFALDASDPAIQRRGLDLRAIGQSILGVLSFQGTSHNFTLSCREPRDTVPGGDVDKLVERGVSAVALVSTLAEVSQRPELQALTPGIQLNSSWVRNSDDHTRASTLFHEFIHHAGFFHHNNFDLVDWVYQLEFCCTGGFTAAEFPDLGHLPNRNYCLQVLAADHEAPNSSLSELARVKELISPAARSP